MRKSLLLAMVGPPLCALQLGCGILGPEEDRPDSVVVTGTVYVDGVQASGFGVDLSFLKPGCALFCDLVVEKIGATDTGADGTYRLEAESDGGWSCDTELLVTPTVYPILSQRLVGCGTHSGVDFHL